MSLPLTKKSQPLTKKFQPLTKKSQPLPKKSQPLPKKSQPSRKNLNPLKFLSPTENISTPLKISQPHAKKSLPPPPEIFQPRQKILNLNPSRKKCEPSRNNVNPKNMLRDTLLPPTSLFTSFPSLFKKISIFFLGGVNLNRPPPLKYALEYSCYNYKH